MKKQLVAIVALSLTACSTTGQTVSQKNGPQRGIAQDSRIEYEKKVARFGPVCGHAPNANVDASFNGDRGDGVRLVSRMERVTDHEVRIPVYDCETTEGDGRGGDWKGFYDRAGNKANQLAAAIKGVGAAIAPHLVPYFQKGKPRSWRQFSDLIVSAAAKIEGETGINRGWASNVLKQHKRDNIVDLGYAGATNCRVVREDVERYQLRELIEERHVKVHVRVTGAKLLPGECDEFSVSYDGREVVAQASDELNIYQSGVTHEEIDREPGQLRARVSFRGVRKAVSPPYLISTQSSSAVANGNAVTLTVQNPRLNEMQQVPDFARACKASASVTIYGRKGSGWFAKKSEALKSATFDLDANSPTTTKTVDGVSLPAENHPVVDISAGFAAGCPFFNATRISNGRIEE